MEGHDDRRAGERPPAGRDPSGAAPARPPSPPRLTPPPGGARTPIPTPLPGDLGLPSFPPAIARRSRAAIGVDLGTTHSTAAIVRGGRPQVIPSRDGHPSIPSVVALSPRGRLVAGHAARAQLLSDGGATAAGTRRLLGRAFACDLVQEVRARGGCAVVPGPDGAAAVQVGPVTLSAEQATALVLREVKGVAQEHLGEEVNRAVIAVPAYFDGRQRDAVRAAAALAGLHVERLVTEPTAAALAHARATGNDARRRLLVYDLGGGSFDAAVVEADGRTYEVVAAGGDPFLGGAEFDAHLTGLLLEAWERTTGAPPPDDGAARSRLAEAAERAKRSLSERDAVRVALPFLAVRDGAPLSLDAEVTRAELAARAGALVERTVAICAEVLEARGLGPADVDEVLLVGGQSRMPLVRARLLASFGKEPVRAAGADEPVALGAALVAQLLDAEGDPAAVSAAGA